MDSEEIKQIQEVIRQTQQREMWARTFFNEDVVTEKQYQIALSSMLPLSGQRDIQTTANGGSIADNSNNYTLQSGTSANGVARLESVDKTLYIPGSVLGWGVGIRPTSLPTDTGVIRFGLLKNDAGSYTGTYYRLDSEGLWAVNRDDVTGLLDQTVQTQWNLEQMDGNGRGVLDILSGNMFRGKFGYYGFTPFLHEIGQTFTNRNVLDYDSVPVNIFKRDGDISISTPNLPITVEVDGGANGEDLSVQIGGRQAVSYGKLEGVPYRNITGLRRGASLTAGTFYPIVAFKGKSGWEDVRKKITKITIDADASGAWRLVETAPADGTLDTPPLGYSASEVATNFNITATSAGSGQTIASGLFSGSRAESTPEDVIIGRYMKDNQDYTLELDLDTNGDASASVTIKEYF